MSKEKQIQEYEGKHGKFKVINAGNCLICGRKIKIVTWKESNKLPNIFFCQACDKRRLKKESEEIIINEKYHTCGRCKWDAVPEDCSPCSQCIHGPDNREDFWQYAGSEE